LAYWSQAPSWPSKDADEGQILNLSAGLQHRVHKPEYLRKFPLPVRRLCGGK
jgi:hypothetical protein